MEMRWRRLSDDAFGEERERGRERREGEEFSRGFVRVKSSSIPTTRS